MSTEKRDVTAERGGFALAQAKLGDSLVRVRRTKEALPHVRIADRQHDPQYVAPGLRIEHDPVRKHAAIPADVSKGARWVPSVIP